MTPKWHVGKPCLVKLPAVDTWLPAVVVEMRGGRFGTPVVKVTQGPLTGYAVQRGGGTRIMEVTV